MASDLTMDMIHLLVRGLMKLVDEIPANEANAPLLQQCKQTLEWILTRAQQIGYCPETTEMFSTSIGTVSQMIDRANEPTKAKFAKQAHEPGQTEALNLANLLAAWDRDFPDGSAAVLAQLDEIASRVEPAPDSVPNPKKLYPYRREPESVHPCSAGRNSQSSVGLTLSLVKSVCRIWLICSYGR